jgi:predicted nuclease of predicted toxin-antitoxin system
MRVLIDMNLTPRWVGYLIEARHEAVHWSGIGPVTAKDHEICAFCRLHDYVSQA